MRKLDLDTLKTVSGGGSKDSGYGHDKGDKGGKGGKGKDKS